LLDIFLPLPYSENTGCCSSRVHRKGDIFMITKNQKELLDFLGPQYSIKTIDGEPCIYRKINSHYDIEISGTRAKSSPLAVFIWDISHGTNFSAQIVEKVFDIPDKDTLLQVLNSFLEKYKDLT
jgi:hypothetical protein